MCNIIIGGLKCPSCSEEKKFAETIIDTQKCDAEDKEKCVKTEEVRWDESTCASCAQDEGEEEGGYTY